eukprot:TRINITY_DN3124_c0_g2_i7.p1 TRINITY_DN3124_c0_g2~~TRINITY_DN3124_c0_g2_i7.p1  ORF type:complete len:176 (-),score=3.22 TRINITY_DN3124_c0_g2_i7:140-667(-)
MSQLFRPKRCVISKPVPYVWIGSCTKKQHGRVLVSASSCHVQRRKPRLISHGRMGSSGEKELNNFQLIMLRRFMQGRVESYIKAILHVRVRSILKKYLHKPQMQLLDRILLLATSYVKRSLAVDVGAVNVGLVVFQERNGFLSVAMDYGVEEKIRPQLLHLLTSEHLLVKLYAAI